MKKVKNKEKAEQKKERRLPKLHLLDIVIILLVIAVLVGIYFRYNVFDMIGNLQNQNEVNVTFSVENIQDTTRYYIDIGDAVIGGNGTGKQLLDGDGASQLAGQLRVLGGQLVNLLL